MFKISISYCKVWHYTDRAVSLTVDLIKHYEHDIESITLVPSDGGRFEVEVNDKLLFSKLATNRHAMPGEIMKLMNDTFQEGRKG